MYEKMPDKTTPPTVEYMTEYCGEMGEVFLSLSRWLEDTCGTETKIVFPYGNKYGWGVSHRKKKGLICDVFPENNAFAVMMRLKNSQFAAVYGQMAEYSKNYIDHRYPCGR